MLTKSDIIQLEKKGIKVETVKQQLEKFVTGFPFLKLQGAATPGNGVVVLDEDAVEKSVARWDYYISHGGDAEKLVPASGAASRMFKALFSFVDSDEVKPAVGSDVENVIANIDKFAFATELDSILKEKYGFSSIAKLDSIFSKYAAKNVFLNGFNQVQFEHIAPFIKDTTEILYLFKCPKIHDISLLSTFKMLRCVHIYWNNSLECLWDMQNNSNLQVLSFVYVTKLKHIENLIDSPVEYIHFDSSDNLGRKKKLLVDESVFSKMGELKYSFLQ